LKPRVSIGWVATATQDAKLTFLVEFPSMDALKQWYESEEYQEPKALRLRSADFDILFIDGA